MACITLKRSNEIDILCNVPPKRQKCSSSFPVNCKLHVDKSLFIPSSQITQDQIQRKIRDEMKRLQRRRLLPRLQTLSPPVNNEAVTNICEPNSPLEDVAAYTAVTTSLRSMAIRSPTHDSQTDSDTEPSSSHQPQTSDCDERCAVTNKQSSAPETNVCTPVCKEKYPLQSLYWSDNMPLFTLSQVTTLCDRLMREREEQLREEYDTILSCKLAEQYESLLKFSQDLLRVRYQDAPMSYVS